MSITIKTDNKWRDLLRWNELTDKEKKEFDWSYANEEFVRYKGCVYCLDEFSIIATDSFKGWDGYAPDSFFSAVLIKLSSDHERVKMGTYLS